MCKTLQSAGKVVAIILVFTLLSLQSIAQYCIPNVTSGQCAAGTNMFINNFSTTGGFTNITNNSTACGNSSTSYIDYSKNHKHTGVQGTVVNFSYTIGTTNPQGVKIFVDYNGDLDFVDAGEECHVSSGALPTGTTVKGSFTIPLTAKPGLTRLRIRTAFNNITFTSCDNQAYGETEDYTFEIIPNCSAKFTTDPQDAEACETGEALYTVAATATDSFHWEVDYGTGWMRLGNDLNHSGVLTDSLLIKNLTFGSNGFQYRAVAHNASEGCTVNSKPAKLSMVHTSKSSIVIVPNPNTLICEKTPVILYSSWTNGGSTPKYQWMVNGLDVEGAIHGTFATDSLRTGDQVECRFISSNICVYPEISNAVSFTVNDWLQPEVSLATTNNGGGSYTFTAMPVNGGTNPNYQWWRNNTIVSGVNGDSYTPNNLYTGETILVEMFSNEKCLTPGGSRVKSDFITIAPVSISNSNMTIEGLALLPNPNNGNFTIQGTLDKNVAIKDAKVTIVNTLGQIVYNEIHPTNGNSLSIPVSLNDRVANGIYTINITVGTEVTSMRFVINR